MHKTQAVELLVLGRMLKRVVENRQRLARAHFYTELMSELQTNWGEVVNYSLLAIPMFLGGAVPNVPSWSEVRKTCGCVTFAGYCGGDCCEDQRGFCVLRPPHTRVFYYLLVGDNVF